MRRARFVAAAVLSFGFARSWSGSARAGDGVVVAPEAVVRTGPYEAAPELVRLHAGDRVMADDKPWSIWRRVRLPDGRRGMMHDLDIELKPPGTSAAKAPTLQPLPLPGAAPDGVFVDVRTTEPDVRIDRIYGGTLVPVCAAPCRQVLPRNADYFIEGIGGGVSFVLPKDKPRLTLDVESPSTGLGWTLIATGTALVSLGGAGFMVGVIACGETGDTPEPCSPRYGLIGGLLLSGFVVGGLGVYAVATARWSVTTSDGLTLVEAGPRPRKRPALVALTPRGLEF